MVDIFLRGASLLLVRPLRVIVRACVLAFALLLPLTSAALAAGDANRSDCPPGTEASPGFRTFLPDCRAYELVSPPYTQGATVQLRAASEEGSRLIGWSTGGFAGAESSLRGAQYEFARTPIGWSAQPIDPPASDPRFATFEYLAASADLAATLWYGSSARPPEETSAGDLYLREEGPGGGASFTDIGPGADFVGASSDLGHVFLVGTFPGDTTKSGPSLYEYIGVGNTEPRLVGVRNEGLLHGSPHVNEGARLVSECGTELGSPYENYNAISSDGETVFFTALHGSCAEPSVNELYARVDGERTVDISEPILPAGEQCTSVCASAPRSEGVFQGASADGSKVFFLTSQPLINDDRDTTRDLYEAELSGGAISRLTLVSEGETHGTPAADDATPGQGAQVLGVVRDSEDGSHVYFVAEGVLTKAPNSEGTAAAPGGRNLYVYDTETERTAFIGTLQSQAEEGGANLQIWRQADSRAAQATPNGRYLLFSSLAHLTADDTSGPLVPQLFLYDAETAHLARVSIGQGGFAADGNSNSARDTPYINEPDYGYDEATRPTTTASSSNLTESGAVFFTSADGLTPQALSGQSNVYEYSAGGLYLISDGQDTTVGSEGQSSVGLLTVAAAGQDAFFTTASSLVPQATGSQVSWYDARAGGGFPAPVSPVECGQACQRPGYFVPSLGAPPSTSYLAGENATPAALHVQPSVQAGALTRAPALASALRACRHKRRSLRKACERRASLRYAGRSPKATRRRFRPG